MNNRNDSQINQIIEKVLMGTLAAIAMLGVNQLKEMNANLNLLSEKFAVINEKFIGMVDKVNTHEMRIVKLEDK